MSLGPVIDCSDSMIFAMAIPNVVGLYLPMSFVRDDSTRHGRKVEIGEIRKVGAADPKVKHA